MQENNFYIYRYWIILNGKDWSYIGKTCKTQESRRGSIDTFCGYKQCSAFYSAVHKYGPRNFHYEVIESGLTKDEAFEREKYWIQHYNSIEQGWNITSGGRGNAARRSEETKRKISQSLIGTHPSEETRKKLSDAHKGEKHHFYGKHLSEEHVRKLSESHRGQIPWMKGKHHTEESNKRNAESQGVFGVLQFTLDGQFVAEYPSIKEAARQLNVHYSLISACCHGRRKSTGSFAFNLKEN